MQTRPTVRGPQTSKQAKAEYKKYGHRFSTQETRQLARGAELFKRAGKLKEAEQRRRLAKQRKLEKEEKEREARKRMGVQEYRPAIARSQCLLEEFIKIERVTQPPQQEVQDSLVEDVDVEEEGGDEVGEPEEESDDFWSDEELDDNSLLDCVKPRSPTLVNILNTSSKPMSSDALIRIELEDAWDDFLTSNTQIEREISQEPRCRNVAQALGIDSFLSFLSTQDVSFTEDDLDELGVLNEPQALDAASPESQAELDRRRMPPPPIPHNKPFAAASTHKVYSTPPVGKYAAARSPPEGKSDSDVWPPDFVMSTQDICDDEF